MLCRAGCRRAAIIASRRGRSMESGRPSRTGPSSDHFYQKLRQALALPPLSNCSTSAVFAHPFVLQKRGLELVNSAGEQRIYINMTATRLLRTIKQFSVEFLLTADQLTIEAKTSSDDFLLRTELANQRLPVSFTNIFDSVTEVFEFARKEEAGSMEIGADYIKFVVRALKVREIRVDMQRLAISKEELLLRKVEKIEKKTASLETFVEINLPKQTYKLVEDYVKKAIRPLAEEIKKFNEKVAHLEERIKQSQARSRVNPANPFSRMVTNPNSLKQAAPSAKNNKETEKTSAEKTSIEKTSTEAKKMDDQTMQLSLSKLQKGEIAPQSTLPRGKVMDFIFDVDQSNKYIQYYTIDKNTITKKRDNQEIIMLYASNPIPPTDRYSIKIRVNQITDGFIWIGLISEAKKSEQYIGEEQGIVQFSLEGNQVLINGKSFPLTFQEFKNGNVLGMQVEISTRKIRFYRNGRTTAMLKLTLPESMAAAKLFPYIQMVNNGDSVTFL